MDDQDWLAERFEANRSHLRGVAYRMLGSLPEADDAVQEAWIRLSRTDTSDVGNLRAWLSTVVGRVCLNAAGARAEELVSATPPVIATASAPATPRPTQCWPTPSGGVARRADTLTPAERLAFVLHDTLRPVRHVGSILGRSPTPPNNSPAARMQGAGHRVDAAAEYPPTHWSRRSRRVAQG